MHKRLTLQRQSFARTGKSLAKICQFDGHFGAFQSTNESLIPTHWQVIEFQLKLRSNETVFKVEMHNDTGYEQLKITPSPMIHIEVDYDVWLQQVKISLANDCPVGFAVWDIIVDRQIAINPKQVHLSDLSTLKALNDPFYGSQIYLVNNSIAGNRAHMNFTFDDPDSSKVYCFELFLSKETPIDLYVSVLGQGTRHMTRFTRLNINSFCLSSYIYIRQLGRFNMSFVFSGDVKSEDEQMVKFKSSRYVVRDYEIKKDCPPDFFPLEGIESYSASWWYNNPSLYDDYTVVANCKTPLYVCDILSNCYPYERNQIDHVEPNETVYNFTLSEQYKKLLSHSPLIRLKSDDVSFTFYRNTSYYSSNEIALNRIESYLSVSSPKLKFLSSKLQWPWRYHWIAISYQMQVHRQTRIPLSIPIHTVDLRNQLVHLLFVPLSTRNSVVKVAQANVNGVNIKLNDSITYVNSDGNTVFYPYNCIRVASWNITNDIKSFEIEFEIVDKSHTGNDSQLMDLGIAFSVSGWNNYDYLGKPPKFGIENCHKGPTYGGLDCLYDEYECPQYYFKYDPIAKTCTRTDAPVHP